MQLGDEEKVKLFYGGTFAMLRDALSECPSKGFLWAGHADYGYASYGNTLVFTVPGGSGVLYTPPKPEEIADLLFQFSVANGGLLELVVLNGCESYELGLKVLEKGIPYVVCWGTKTHDAAGRLFAKIFFQHLASRKTPYVAFEQAVKKVADEYVMEGQHPLPPKTGMSNAAKRNLWLHPGRPRDTPGVRLPRAGVPVLLTKAGKYTVDELLKKSD